MPSRLLFVLILLFATAILTTVHAQSHPVLGCFPDNPRTDCGNPTITQQQCLQKGCCWLPVNPNPNNEPWCVNQTMGVPPPPFSPPADGLPFNSTERALMMSYFLENINVCCIDSSGPDGTEQCQNCGGVVAAPDYNTGPGGNYCFAWIRDSALSMRALMNTNNDTTKVMSLMKNYVNWVLTNQAADDPNDIDIRTEPKFTLPTPGYPFTGGWCRPQTDGPGLRATTLIQFANALLANQQQSFVQQYLWTGDSSKYNGGAIKFDLDWVAANWASSGCDLWEEIQSDDFFWNRYTMRYALVQGSALATAMGDSSTAASYTAAAAAINATLSAHYNGQFVYESTNRQEDSAVIIAFTVGYLNDGVFAPDSQEVAGTLLTLAELFHGMFYINQQDDKQKVPGVLFGRYQGDTYGAGGAGPWILCTGAAAQAVYDAGLEVLRKNALPSLTALKLWGRLFEVDTLPSTPAEFAAAALSAGDGILMRIRAHVEAPAINFRLSEQFDPTTGAEQSAQSLTWSYSQVLLACRHRDMLVAAQHGQ